MNTTKHGVLLVLNAGLFPDASTLEAALPHVPDSCRIRHHRVAPDKMDDDAWDRLLGNILTAETILTL